MKYIKTKIMFGVGCFIFFALLVCVGYEYFKISEFKNNIVAIESELDTEKISLDNYTYLVKTASNIKSESEKVNTFFIKKDEIVNFLDSVEKLSSISNTIISVQSLGEKEPVGDQHILNVQVHIQGDYSDVFKAIQLLEELPYYTEIQSVKLSNVETRNEKNKKKVWQADVSFIGVML
ncbi:MAG: hypothetical protein WCO12_03025 [bacterium]